MKQFIAITSITVLLGGCSKSNISEVASPDFDVTVNSITLKAGDTAQFTFHGNPDFISFYSGETGHQYANRKRTVLEGGKPTLAFTTYASTVGTQANSLKILASTDFTGVYDTLNNSITNATWIDLTPRAILSSGADNTSSGTIDISDINPEKKTIWFAFKKHDDSSATLKPWAWAVKSFNVNLFSPTENQTYSILNFANAGWYATDIKNAAYKWSISGTAMTIGGGGLNTPENEDWVITNPVNIYTVPPDIAEGIKSIDARLSSYSYVFANAGTYKVTFVASNQNINTKKENVKELTITVL